ncbi:MAG: copper-translocating P-type ATPase [Campylobacterota bacterium]
MKHHDHTHHHKMMIVDFKKRFFISLVVTIPILLLSPMVQDILSFNLSFMYDKYLLFTLSTFIYVYGGKPFLIGLKDELAKKTPGMMTLIAVAISVAFLYSTATTFGMEGKSFFWELATLIDVMLLGHWIEMKSVVHASNSLEKLVELIPTQANLIEKKETKRVSVDKLKKDDKVLVQPGERIPVDGFIIEGESNVNESMVTGESKPVKKSKDSKVIGGTINGNGSLTINVKGVGKDSYLSRVIDMVQEAGEKKSKTQNLADKIAFWLTITSLSVGFMTLVIWLALGKELVFALERMASVMVITCPHALGLAVPLVVAISTAVSAKNGLLIRNRSAFENARKISLIAFDKTGTLTKGDFGVTRYKSTDTNRSDDELLSLIGALEKNSEHPIAMGIINKLKEKNLSTKEVEKFDSIVGEGIKGIVNSHEIKIVNPNYLKKRDIQTPKDAIKDKNETVIIALQNEKPIGYVALSDEIRKESYQAIKDLKNSGIKVYMITGDNEKSAKEVSDKLSLDGYYFDILPDKKLELIEKFQKKGEFVAMTGDGINDAPALKKADIGIAVGSGTDIASDSADIVLVNSNPKDISALIMFGKATYRKMIENFIWATGYNIVAIPLAAGALYSYGILINPAVGAVLMSLSTVIVAINAQLLKRKLKI